MLKDMKIRVVVLAVHGTLALVLALAFFYLGAAMTNLIFEALAVVIALMLTTAALLLAGLADFFAACSEGLKHGHRFVLYMTAGLALAVIAVALGCSAQATLRWLLIAASLHALFYGIAALISAVRLPGDAAPRRIVSIFGALSILSSGIMTGVASFEAGSRPASLILGCYLMLVVIRIFYSVWVLDRSIEEEERSAPIYPRLAATQLVHRA